MARGVLVEFISGALIYQAYIYANYFSPYDDVFDTRQRLVQSLGLLAFVLNIIVIYRCQCRDTSTSQCGQTSRMNTDKAKETNRGPITGTRDVSQREGGFNNPKAILSHKIKQTIPHCAKCNGINSDSKLSENVQHRIEQPVQINNLPGLYNVSTHLCRNMPCEPMKRPDNSIEFPITEAESDGGLLQHLWGSCCQQTGQGFRSLLDLAVDVMIVYVGIVCLYQVLEYRILFNWSYKGLDFLELFLIPVTVIFVEVSYCVTFLLQKVFHPGVTRENRTSSKVLHI